MKKALIFGISGQDGTLLSEFLIKKNYKIYGASRNKGKTHYTRYERIQVFNISFTDYNSVLKLIKNINPDEIYNLAGESSVNKSFSFPLESIYSTIIGNLHILEAIRELNLSSRYFFASSSDCFGNTISPATEETKLVFNSPYGLAKKNATETVNLYRDVYGIYACSGFLSPHESYLRNPLFISKKIVETAKNIKKGKSLKLEIGNTNIIRDWGWAEDYVEAMYLMLQQEIPNDFIIATGKSITLLSFIEYTFNNLGLDHNKYLISKKEFARLNDIETSYLNPHKANILLGWSAKHIVYDVIDKHLKQGNEI